MSTPDVRAIDHAITILGSQAELARQLRVTAAYVNKMVKTGRVPAQRCRQIELATGGQVKAVDLRPDIFAPAVPMG